MSFERGGIGEIVEVALDASPGAAAAEAAEPEAYRSPDGRFTAAVRRDEDGVWLDVLDTGTEVATYGLAGPDDRLEPGPKELARAVDGVPLVVAWSPDSEYLAFGSITGAPWALWVVDARTWRASVYEVKGGYVGEAAWSPDGERLAISTYQAEPRDHRVLIFDRTAVTVRYLIDGCTVVWSPDGRFVAVHREPRIETGVWVASVADDSRYRVTGDESAFAVSWTEGDDGARAARGR